MQKKLAAAIMTAAAVTMVSGCSQTSAPQSEGAVTQDAQSQGTEAGAQTEDQTSLTIMLHVADKSTEKTFSSIWDGFQQAHPEIKLEYIGNNGSEEQMKKVKLAAESNTLPDIFWCSNATAKEMAEAGYLMDLSDYRETSSAAASIPQNLIEEFYQDQMLYGLPYQCQIKGFWINKAVFEENGLTPPVQGTTYEELLDMVDTLHANGVTTFINGAKTPYSCWSFLTAWARYGYYSHVADILDGKDTFENPDFVNYFAKLQELAEHGAFSENITTTDYDQAVEYFVSGKAAILDSGSWAAGSDGFAKLGDQIGFWWGPVFEDGVGNQKVSMQIPSSPLCVNAEVANDPEKLEAVSTFFDYYYGQEAAKISVETGSVPVVTYEGELVSQIPAFTAMMEAASDKEWVSPSAGPDMIVSSAVQSALYDALYGVMSGVYTPEQALEQIDVVQQQQ